jgi:hypothetical protein
LKEVVDKGIWQLLHECRLIAFKEQLILVHLPPIIEVLFDLPFLFLWHVSVIIILHQDVEEVVKASALIRCLVEALDLIHDALVVAQDNSEDHDSKEHSKCEEESLHVTPGVKVSEPNCGQSGKGKVDEAENLEAVRSIFETVARQEIIIYLFLGSVVELMPVVEVTLELQDESEEHCKEKAGAGEDDEDLDQLEKQGALDNVAQPCLILQKHSVHRIFNLLLLAFHFPLLLLLDLALDALGHSVLVHV